MKRFVSLMTLIGCIFAASILLAEDAAGPKDNTPVAGAATDTATAPTTQASQPATASQPSEGDISGKVTRENAGGAVANAKVELLNAKGKAIANVQSDASGIFVLKNVPAGKGYTLRVFDPGAPAGAEGQKKGISVQANEVTDVGAITVYALPGGPPKN